MLLCSLGQGATSVVHEALCKPLNRKCAMKIINLDKSSTSASLEEINVSGSMYTNVILARDKVNEEYEK